MIGQIISLNSKLSFSDNHFYNQYITQAIKREKKCYSRLGKMNVCFKGLQKLTSTGSVTL